jgi:hypothetical protein
MHRQMRPPADAPFGWRITHTLAGGSSGTDALLCWAKTRADAATIANALCYAYGGSALLDGPQGEQITMHDPKLSQ